MTPEAGIRIGAALIAVAVIATLAWTLLMFAKLDDDIAAYPRVEVPGRGTVELEARKYILYLEGVDSDVNTQPVTIVTTHRATERRVRASPYKGTFSYSGSDEIPLTAVATLTAPLAGTYDVRTRGAEDLFYDLAFGDSLAGRSGRIIAVSVAIPVVLGLAALAVWVTSGGWSELRRRPRWRGTID